MERKVLVMGYFRLKKDFKYCLYINQITSKFTHTLFCNYGILGLLQST